MGLSSIKVHTKTLLPPTHRDYRIQQELLEIERQQQQLLQQHEQHLVRRREQQQHHRHHPQQQQQNTQQQQQSDQQQQQSDQQQQQQRDNQQQQQQQQQQPQPLFTVYVHPGNMREWLVYLHLPAKSIYKNKNFLLRLLLPQQFPFKPPLLHFLKPIPVHPHVYSNGSICLNLLGKDWHPSLSLFKLLLSLFSMLNENKKHKPPLDDFLHAAAPPGSTDVEYIYHDDDL
ncbi:ubiquitin-conjugating enzyme e2, putative [Eimeria tenella]|uniref:Ubiquitin-conjugating enzyme e2, putative n=1 Tax=Eimeria tenella TaxID=5802 RepID=U6KL65_EIMTE|nr:ubiquitin-conjugating enzyme e2, putative [Eimeria tenella]CDJ38847.1 ubiquitin-conjugating enzyme e2, putative [Eimeria tenella]|eukprot:XP_013229602.1 ubiquitin-conjugating enzyme e2, putative [Eimeria tenella]